MFSQSFTVTGMNCGHCVASVTEELETVDGVRDVVVDLPTGQVVLTTERHLDESDIRRVVTEAGFAVAGSVAEGSAVATPVGAR